MISLGKESHFFKKNNVYNVAKFWWKILCLSCALGHRRSVRIYRTRQASSSSSSSSFSILVKKEGSSSSSSSSSSLPPLQNSPPICLAAFFSQIFFPRQKKKDFFPTWSFFYQIEVSLSHPVLG